MVLLQVKGLSEGLNTFIHCKSLSQVGNVLSLLAVATGNGKITVVLWPPMGACLLAKTSGLLLQITSYRRTCQQPPKVGNAKCLEMKSPTSYGMIHLPHQNSSHNHKGE